ncbi:MAG: hypothetical protein EBR30_08990 [Cytophagia bacterium]|nr:hypothetical protein [Cytophagia bacterium]
MNFLKLTELKLNLQGTIDEKTIYVNPNQIKEFHERYMGNFGCDLTSISWANGAFNTLFVKETPDEIVHQLIAC